MSSEQSYNEFTGPAELIKKDGMTFSVVKVGEETYWSKGERLFEVGGDVSTWATCCTGCYQMNVSRAEGQQKSGCDDYRRGWDRFLEVDDPQQGPDRCGRCSRNDYKCIHKINIRSKVSQRSGLNQFGRKVQERLRVVESSSHGAVPGGRGATATASADAHGAPSRPGHSEADAIWALIPAPPPPIPAVALAETSQRATSTGAMETTEGNTQLTEPEEPIYRIGARWFATSDLNTSRERINTKCRPCQLSNATPHGSHSWRFDRERLTSGDVSTAHGGYDDYTGFDNHGGLYEHGSFLDHGGFDESGSFENLSDLHVTSTPADQTLQASLWDPTVANIFLEASTADCSNITDLGGFVEEEYQELDELFDA